ncbi:MAG: VWA domain-containing protein [Bacteriovoracaceae bacterium]|nr:VWA domain-containing protein [Bacteriovoracaceae bacterium]
MSKIKRESNVFSIAFLDLLSGALGAVIILYIAVPKASIKTEHSDKSKIEIIIKEKKEVTRQLNKCRSKNTTYEELVKKNHDDSEKQITALKEKISALKKEKIKTPPPPPPPPPKIRKKAKDSGFAAQPLDVGFQFKGKKIVFVIDVSGSMMQEDRIGQVKAGLKMLITSMSKEFMVNVVSFPNRNKTPFKNLWHAPRFTTADNKKEVYKFLNGLSAYGTTPTREALKHVFEKYSDITDIVLLSDGAPTTFNSQKRDDIYKLLSDLASQNVFDIQVNTIGVGSDFLKDINNLKYIFLSKLAADHNGFFVGF